MDIVENFHAPKAEDSTGLFYNAKEEAARAAYEQIGKFLEQDFIPGTDRLLLKRLPPKPQGLIVTAAIGQEESSYGYVLAIGKDVDVPLGTEDQPIIALFSKYTAAEEITFDDAAEGDQFIVVYKQDVRGWFVRGSVA